jgi:hypothetical protein
MTKPRGEIGTTRRNSPNDRNVESTIRAPVGLSPRGAQLFSTPISKRKSTNGRALRAITFRARPAHAWLPLRLTFRTLMVCLRQHTISASSSQRLDHCFPDHLGMGYQPGAPPSERSPEFHPPAARM